MHVYSRRDTNRSCRELILGSMPKQRFRQETEARPASLDWLAGVTFERETYAMRSRDNASCLSYRIVH